MFIVAKDRSAKIDFAAKKKHVKIKFLKPNNFGDRNNESLYLVVVFTKYYPRTYRTASRIYCQRLTGDAAEKLNVLSEEMRSILNLSKRYVQLNIIK